MSGCRKAGDDPVAKIIVVRTVQASVAALALHWLTHWPLTGPHALGLVVTPLLCVYFVFVFVAPWTWGLPILTRLPTAEKVAALTFDDGPTPETTPAILDVLARYGIPATFFVLGENVGRSPELLRRIVAEGHGIGLHGFQHEPFVLISGKRVGKEITQTCAAVRAVCPLPPAPRWLRPPHGFKTLILPRIAQRHGCRLVTWNVNAGDYRSRDPGVIARAVIAALRPGAVVLLHDGPGNAPTVAALPLILEGLAAAGYRCVTL